MSKFLPKCIFLPLALSLLCGCSLKEDGDIPDMQARVRFDVTTHTSPNTTDGVILSTVRFIAIDKDGTIAYNKSTENGLSSKPGEGDTFEIELPAGNYRLYIVANETPAMSTALDAITSAADLQKIEVKGSFTEENVPLSQMEQIVLRQLQNGLPQISTDGGGTWLNKLTTELVRTQSKVTLHLRKKTGQADVIVIKKVEVGNLPDRCYLLQKTYTPAKGDLQTLTPYNEAAGIRFDTDVDDENAKDNYTLIFDTGNIFPERWTDNPASDIDASYLKIYAEYNGLNTIYTIKLYGESKNGYNLARNVNHIVFATLSSAGNLDANQIYIKPQWWSQQVSGDIQAPYLNVSEPTVPMVFSRTADGIASIATQRIFFWTNVPGDEIAVGDKIENESGDVYDVKGNITTDIQISKSEATPDGGFNTTGYIDLTPSTQLSKIAFNKDATRYGLYLKAGHLSKKLTLERVDYLPTVRFSEIPWIGIFYGATQKGERIVSAQNEGVWTATTEYPAGTGEFVLLDPSIAADKNIYTDSPADAEKYPLASGVQTLSGDGRIYFRVGLTGTSATARAARIKLETTSGTYYIYVKQGQYDYVMRSTDNASSIQADGTLGGSVTRTSTNVKTVSQYALTYYSYSAPAGGSTLGEQLLLGNSTTSSSSILSETGFPTQAQRFFCWNRSNGSMTTSTRYSAYAFHPANPWTGAITPYPYTSTVTPNLSYNTSLYRDGCPTGYQQPTVDQLRYSLFRNIPEQKTDGDYAMAANTADQNYLWGYYADGYFDRRKAYSVDSNTGSATVTTPPCAVSSGANIAYWGILFYNPDTYASLFLPATGYRDASNGELRMAGLGGFLWTQTGDTKTATKKYGLMFSNIDGTLDCRIVGNINPFRAGSFRCVKK